MSIIVAYSFAVWQKLKEICTISVGMKADFFTQWQCVASNEATPLFRYFFSSRLCLMFLEKKHYVEMKTHKQMKDIQNHGWRQLCIWFKLIVLQFFRHRYQWFVALSFQNMIFQLFFSFICLPKSSAQAHAGCWKIIDCRCCWSLCSPLFSCIPWHAPPPRLSLFLRSTQVEKHFIC